MNKETQAILLGEEEKKLSKTKRILTVCLVVAVISTVISVISAVISPETMHIAGAATTGVVTVVILIALLSSSKEGDK